MPTPHVLAELCNLGQANRAKPFGDPFGRHADIFTPSVDVPSDQDGAPPLVGCRHVNAQLEATPYSAVEQFGVVGGGHRDHITRKLVDLHEQERHDTLYLACLVNIATFLTYGVELVEEQNAGCRAGVLEQLRQTSVGLAKISANQGVVAHRQHGQRQGFGHGFRERRLAVAGWPGQQDPVTRLHPLGPQQVRAGLFLDQLARQPVGWERQD